MKKITFALALSGLLSTTLLASDDDLKKGLNLALTAGDTQTQMMSMVLVNKALGLKKDVKVVLCAEAGDLALKDSKSEPQKPMDKSPKDLLQAAIKGGADVKVCPLYLPNKGLDKTALIDGVGVANPDNVIKEILDEDYALLSY